MTATYAKGDTVMGLGRCGARWDRKPTGTVTAIVGETVRVQWHRSAVEDDMAEGDLLRIYWAEALGRYVTIPERES